MSGVSSGKAVLGGAGAAFALVAAVLGYFLYDAYSCRTEADENLETAIGDFHRFNSAAIFPSKKSIADVKTNAAAYASWRAEALELASRGDKVFPEEPETVFKQRLQTEVSRMRALPGGVGGRISAPAFFFGFDQYLGDGGVLPAREDVPRLASQLDTITRVVDICAQAGVLEVKAVQRLAKPQPKEDEDDRSRQRNRKKRRQSKAQQEPEFTSLEYSFELAARPAAVVKVLNSLASDSRFMVVSSLALRESADMIVDKLNAVAAAEQQKSSSRRRGRRGRVRDDAEFNPESDDASAKVDRLVVDPELDAPIVASFKLATYDFGSKSGPNKSEEGR